MNRGTERGRRSGIGEDIQKALSWLSEADAEQRPLFSCDSLMEVYFAGIRRRNRAAGSLLFYFSRTDEFTGCRRGCDATIRAACSPVVRPGPGPASLSTLLSLANAMAKLGINKRKKSYYSMRVILLWAFCFGSLSISSFPEISSRKQCSVFFLSGRICETRKCSREVIILAKFLQ